jgi:hypothetical protein
MVVYEKDWMGKTSNEDFFLIPALLANNSNQLKGIIYIIVVPTYYDAKIDLIWLKNSAKR